LEYSKIKKGDGITIMNDQAQTHTRIASVRKALQVLDFIANNIDGYEVKEISYGTKMNLSTCYHILNTLQDEEYLTKKVDGKYTLGPKIPRLFNAFNKTATPVLEVLNELQKETEETAYLVGVKDNRIIVQSAIESLQSLRVSPLYIGYSENHHARATSKSIIAFWDDLEINDFFSEYEFSSLTKKTPANIDEIKWQIERIRSQGFSLEEEEFNIGICGIAAPIIGPIGKPIGSFGLSLPKERYLIKRDELIEKVVSSASKVSKMAGYSMKVSY
jgi:IclR family acetate operon transcriptional repressor